MSILDFIAFVLAIYLALRFYDRLRLINWKTTRRLYVALYLAHIMWVLSILYDIFDGGMQWHQWFGMAAMVCWLEISKTSWLDGVPDAARSETGVLGPPELERYR